MSTVKGAARLRVVLDTNVYFSAFTHPTGVAFWIWEQAVRRRYVLLTSPTIIREVARVFRRKAGWRDNQIVGSLKLLVKTAEIVSPKIQVRAIPEDDDDNRILECAVEGKADLIVSRDQHLRRLKAFEGIGIVHPVDFRRTLADWV